MGKIQIKSVKNEFEKKMEQELDFYRRILSYLDNSDDDIYRLSSLTLISAATNWELFLNKLFVAYINNNPEKFIEHMSGEFKKLFKDNKKWKNLQPKFAPIISSRDVNREKIISIIDERERNISLSKYEAIKLHASNWLCENDRRRIEKLDDKSIAVINLVGALRDRIIHDSVNAKNLLREAASDENLIDIELYRSNDRSFDPVVYLRAKKFPKNVRRIEKIVELLTEIGKCL